MVLGERGKAGVQDLGVWHGETVHRLATVTLDVGQVNASLDRGGGR
jgi:hypothetical protein